MSVFCRALRVGHEGQTLRIEIDVEREQFFLRVAEGRCLFTDRLIPSASQTGVYRVDGLVAGRSLFDPSGGAIEKTIQLRGDRAAVLVSVVVGEADVLFTERQNSFQRLLRENSVEA